MQHQMSRSRIGISKLYRSSVPWQSEEKTMQSQVCQLDNSQPTDCEVVCRTLTHNRNLPSNTLRKRSKHQRTDCIPLSIIQHISLYQFIVMWLSISYQQEHGDDQHYRGPGNMEVLRQLCARARQDPSRHIDHERQRIQDKRNEQLPPCRPVVWIRCVARFPLNKISIELHTGER